MTNEEKALEIATDYTNQQLTLLKRIEMCMEMAEWKDQQFETKKQKLIDKACEILKIRLSGDCMSKKSLDYFIMKFRKTMEE